MATYTFFAGGGLLFGGELGLLSGRFSARRTVSRDIKSRKRIETAFRKFTAEVMRSKATAIEKGEQPLNL